MKRLLVLAVALAAASCDPDAEPVRAEPDDPLVCTIPSDQIFFSLSPDGIQALTNPQVATAELSVMGADDRVLGVTIGGEARAYPIGILWSHELINDTLGGVPVLISYCPLTGSGIAFDPRVDGGAPRNFGVSGLLYENNLMMFDRTEDPAERSLWNQMLLGSQCGPDRGAVLTRIPILETTWGHWKRLHPNTTFVTTNTGFFFDYRFYPYEDYDDLDNAARLFPGSTFGNARPPKELVLGAHDGNASVAFPFGALGERGAFAAVNELVGNTPLVVFYIDSEQTAIAFDRRVDGVTLTFDLQDPSGPTFVDAETGTTWDAGGVAISGQLAGSQLAQYQDAYVAFWFAWSIYYPGTRLVL